jgi:hypothetical protein
MNILDITDFLNEIRQIGFFGEARELRNVVQTNVDKRFDSRLSERGEKLLGRFFGEPDREDLHLDRPRTSSTRFKPNARKTGKSNEYKVYIYYGLQIFHGASSPGSSGSGLTP